MAAWAACVSYNLVSRVPSSARRLQMHRTAWILVGTGMMGVLGACSSTTSSGTSSAAIEQNKVTGNTSTLASVGLDRAYEGSIRAINGLQFKIESQAKDALKGVIRAKTADGKTVSVDLTKKSDTITEVEVSAGPLEQSLARTVIEKIQGELK